MVLQSVWPLATGSWRVMYDGYEKAGHQRPLGLFYCEVGGSEDLEGGVGV